ncbi:cobalt/nickel transport system permease protein [Candidatus Planktophila sulfonica]|jgi:cobalamin biosynthesis protein CbiM|uniref:Cobalt/nickel transport system permease protein n=1 Tax=Candidatus Planktophila sulfonica TaxID=1884904 RepID=A0A249KI48_9ACTN|nr:energy-coupling factor ABC transporter permease [Candidatus Planktophila sulfonica]ASY16463.1 cobalt/nickel transport system permease protein [Candidatus Planktophila sulfonica]
MHIPDGFIDIPTSTAFAALAAAGVALSIKGAKSTLDEKTAPLAGLTATFIFAVQMLNFPVAAGTSGHLLGGALAAVLVGPYAATLSLTVVLLMQGLLFADGGLTAIGLNVFNMAIIGVWAGYGAFLLLQKILPSSKFSTTISAGLAGLLSVPAAAAGFVLQYSIGANATFSVSAVLTAMISTHVLIGIGEALITAFAVGAVLASRSDLVYGYKGEKQALEIRSAS